MLFNELLRVFFCC